MSEVGREDEPRSSVIEGKEAERTECEISVGGLVVWASSLRRRLGFPAVGNGVCDSVGCRVWSGVKDGWGKGEI